jgi:hypothetical protein
MDITSTNLSAAILDQVIAGQMRGKQYAFTAVMENHAKPWTVGIAALNEPGYYSVAHAEDFRWAKEKEATEFCEAMNKHIGLTATAAAKIIASSMARGRPEQ